MKLPIAVAVLFLVLAANTEAQEAQDPTLEERFKTFGDQITAIATEFVEKTKTTVQGIHNSEFATKTREWVNEQLETVKTRVEETFKKQQ